MSRLDYGYVGMGVDEVKALHSCACRSMHGDVKRTSEV